MSIPSESYKTIIKNDFIIETSLLIKELPVAMVNSIRRILLSNIPTVTFNDTWNNRTEDRHINVLKNTSSLHNEFLNHRLSLVPLQMDNDNLKVASKFSNTQKLRLYSFKNPTLVPKFSLKIKNNEVTRNMQNITEFLQVTTNNFEVIDSEDSSITLPSIDTFIKPDPYTGEYILLNVLKPNILNDDEGEELDLIAKPSPGIGLTNSRFTPVGTVSYSFVTDDVKAESVFLEKMKYKNNERETKGLKEYSSNEVEKLKNSYNLLDKHRTYLTNENGEPNQFNLRVESIGFLNSDQLIYDSIYTLQLMLADIINSISFTTLDEILTVSTKDKIIFDNSNDECIITIINENHTIGNLLSEYFKLFYCSDKPIIYDLFKFVSYRMPHPLTENIEMKLILNNDLTTADLIKIYNSLSKKFSPTVKNITTLSNNTNKELLIMIFVKTLALIKYDINNLMNEWSGLSSINTPSYVIEEDQTYFDLHSSLGESFDIVKLLK
uniref:DNA-directed RNA polymerase RpoA/D/Rpb3-type domain-containing protein n=1 Tax=viral metagenome TaxID=1070528 RepID=A0A6C0EHB9_9ZZZZ